MSGEGRSAVDTHVLIVGAGPVGLGLATDLGRRGVPCHIVEQGDGTFPFPRANAVNVRTMEFCRRWGIVDEVCAAAIPPDYPHTALYVTSLVGYEIGRVERPNHGGNRPSRFSPERPQRCNQMFFDPILRRRVESFPSTRLEYRTRFETFSQDAEKVTASVTRLDTGKTEELTARYLVACCAGHSSVRNTLGISLHGLPQAGTPIHIFFRARSLWDHHDKGKAALYYVMGPTGRWATLISIDGRDLWSLAVEVPGRKGTVNEEEARAYMDRALGKKIDYQLQSISYWTRREMVAESYGSGRVLIAGDCAHLNGPEGGYGMNTGMGDAVDLGWKLWADYAGWAGRGMIASYEADRRPIALRNVAEATKNLQSHEFDYPRICEDSAEGAAQRQACREQIDHDGERRHGHDGIALGYRYESPLIVRDGEGEPPEDNTSHYEPSSYPGCRAPHCSLDDGRSSLDLFGHGFVLLRLGSAPPDTAGLERAMQERSIPLDTVSIADTEMRTVYERDLVLVRPDGHVAWRGNAPPDDPKALADAVRGG